MTGVGLVSAASLSPYTAIHRHPPQQTKQAGATTLNVPDTVGYTTPSEFKTLIRGLRANVKGACCARLMYT